MGEFRLILFIGISIVLVVLTAYFVTVAAKKRQYFAQLDELEEAVAQLSEGTVVFELAKLKSSKKSERIAAVSRDWHARWEDIETQKITVTENLIYAEELVNMRNFAAVAEGISESQADIQHLQEEIATLADEILSLKKSEERSRSGIVSLKEQFASLKERYEENEDAYLQAADTVKALFKEIGGLFVKFNECMDESAYDLADEAIELIRGKNALLENVFTKMPVYEATIEGEVRPLLKDVLSSYKHMSGEGVYLKHLQIEETIKLYREDLNTLLELVRTFEFTKIENYLMEMTDNARQMIIFMKKEVEYQETIQKEMEALKEEIQFIKSEGQALGARYENIRGNCALPYTQEEIFMTLLNEIQIVAHDNLFLLGKMEERSTPNTYLHRDLNQILEQVESIKVQLQAYDKEIEGLYAGEKECRYRAMALLKQFNSLKGHYQALRLPRPNPGLLEAVREGDQILCLLFETIARTPIDIEEIHDQLAAAQEVISETSRWLDQETKDVLLAEKMMVYGHRYSGREGMFLVELTIAEDQFRQGHYQKVIQGMEELLTSIEGSRFDVVFYQFKQDLQAG